MTPNQICIQLAAQLGKSIGTTRTWVKKGMPTDSMESAIQWIEAGGMNIKQPEPAAIAAIKELQAAAPPLIDSNAPMSELLVEFPQAVQIAVALREAGVSQAKICEATGFSQKIVTRICREHPDLAPKEKELARKDWEDIRRMSQGRLKELLADDEAAKRFKPAELATVAGIAADKLDSYETPQQAAINIRTKIMAMSHAEIIQMIVKPSGSIEPNSSPSTNFILPKMTHHNIPALIETTPEGLVQPDGACEENATDL